MFVISHLLAVQAEQPVWSVCVCIAGQWFSYKITFFWPRYLWHYCFLTLYTSIWILKSRTHCRKPDLVAAESKKMFILHVMGDKSAPIQLAQCRLSGLAISYVKLLKYFSNKICGSNFVKRHSETVMVWNYQNAGCSLRKKLLWSIFRHTFVPYGWSSGARWAERG